MHNTTVAGIPHFYYHDRMLDYDFGPRHPLRPERLARTVALLRSVGGLEPIDPGLGDETDLLRVHDTDYIACVRKLSGGEDITASAQRESGFGSMDNPVFSGMHEAAMAYVAGTARAARAACEGAPLAFGMAGGLHHAHRARASGFCIYDDPAIAVHILLEAFDKVAYVDIDLHHGDGVQGIFSEEPRVLTCSIHESGRTLFPGTGFVEEVDADGTILNVPLAAGTTGDVWLWAFRQTIIPALGVFRPGALVLQMGTDAHFLDPLGHLRVTAQEWLGAVAHLANLGIPIVALGGGGYEPTCVPRMWAAAVLTLAGLDVPAAMPEEHQIGGAMPMFFDEQIPLPRNAGRTEAELTVDLVHDLVLRKLLRS